MLARALSFASTHAHALSFASTHAHALSLASTHARALSSAPRAAPGHEFLTNIIAGIEGTKENIFSAIEGSKPTLPEPPASDLSTPPVGTQHPPPRGPRRQSPDERIIKMYSNTIPCYRLYCHSTRNNTITTLMTHESHHVASFTGGVCEFKKGTRASYEAGYQCAVHMFRVIEKLAKKHNFTLALHLNGFGQGRDAMHRALLTSEGDGVRRMIVSLTDKTPIKIGGTRSKKARRL